jgi:hypothetical protein
MLPSGPESLSASSTCADRRMRAASMAVTVVAFQDVGRWVLLDLLRIAGGFFQEGDEVLLNGVGIVEVWPVSAIVEYDDLRTGECPVLPVGLAGREVGVVCPPEHQRRGIHLAVDVGEAGEEILVGDAVER